MGNCEGLCLSKNPRNPIYNDKVKNTTVKMNYTFPNGDYYIGPFINNLPNGQGKTFTKNGKVRYQGNFVNGCLQGKGKLYFDNDEYYEGDFLNNVKHGKGKLYYPNGQIKYDGDFANDKFDGYGKYVLENGENYIGEWSNGLRHGKGAVYESNGYLKQQGNYINGNYEGEDETGVVNRIGALNEGTGKVKINFGSQNGELYYEDGYFYGDINSPYQNN